MAKFNPVNIEPRPYMEQPTKIKTRFTMFKIINWKTTVIGLLILLVKFFGTTFGISPDLISYIVTTLTGLLGFIGADSSLVKKL